MSEITTQQHSDSPITQDISRLYIAPLTPELLRVILPPKLHDIAQDILYYAPETFPENTFGYLSIPSNDASRLKSKLNGSILRGQKMRVEDARPDKASRRKTRAAAQEDSPSPEDKIKHKEKKKSKKLAFRHAAVTDENKVLPAVELPEGRSVKRGWSSSSKSKSKKHGREDEQKHDSSEKGGLIFRTKISDGVHTDEHDKKPKEGKDKKERRHAKSKSTTEVTEFGRTTAFPTFLRDSKLSENQKRASEFIDGKGWVDEDGKVVEAVEGSRKRRKTRASADAGRPSRNTVTPDTAIPSKEADIAPLGALEPSQMTSDISEKGISTTQDPSVRPTSQLSDLGSSVEPKPESKEVHPLEALFKRPALKTKGKINKNDDEIHRPTPIKTGFSFFSSDEVKDGIDDDRVGLMMPPQTPFTRQDMEMRGIRSAAPTPDTAAIGAKFHMPWRRNTTEETEASDKEDDDDDDNDDDDDDDTEGPTGAEDDPETKNVSNDNGDGATPTIDSKGGVAADGKEEEPNEFEKQFWENRADYNRAWKARQKEARKQTRQNENRRRGSNKR